MYATAPWNGFFTDRTHTADAHTRVTENVVHSALPSSDLELHRPQLDVAFNPTDDAEVPELDDLVGSPTDEEEAAVPVSRGL